MGNNYELFRLNHYQYNALCKTECTFTDYIKTILLHLYYILFTVITN